MHGAHPRVTRQSTMESSWSQLKSSWTIDRDNAILSVSLLGTSPLAQAARAEQWVKDQSYEVLRIHFGYGYSGFDWYLLAFYSRAAESRAFAKSYAVHSSEEEKKGFKHIGHRYLCLLLKEMKRYDLLGDRTMIGLTAVPSVEKRLEKYYTQIGFRVVPQEDYKSKDWTNMEASVRTLIRFCA